jgi:hypothetical protein
LAGDPRAGKVLGEDGRRWLRSTIDHATNELLAVLTSATKL